jgi:hypothetical protein
VGTDSTARVRTRAACASGGRCVRPPRRRGSVRRVSCGVWLWQTEGSRDLPSACLTCPAGRPFSGAVRVIVKRATPRRAEVSILRRRTC